MLSVTLLHLLGKSQVFLRREGSLLHSFILKHPGDVVMEQGELIHSDSCTECCDCTSVCACMN